MHIRALLYHSLDLFDIVKNKHRHDPLLDWAILMYQKKPQ